MVVAVLAGGLFLCLKRNLPKVWTSIACVTAPLVLTWFFSDPFDDVFVAAFAGGALVALVFAGQWAGVRFGDWRRARLSIAPDPFLEQAGLEDAEPQNEPSRATPETPPATPEEKAVPQKSRKKTAKQAAKKPGKKTRGGGSSEVKK